MERKNMTSDQLHLAKDKDLIASFEAMKQAAQDARQTAIQTNTSIVIFVNGKLVHKGADELRLEQSLLAGI
jgi:hypothetical protein